MDPEDLGNVPSGVTAEFTSDVIVCIFTIMSILSVRSQKGSLTAESKEKQKVTVILPETLAFC